MTTLDEQFNLVPPCNVEAEEACLGSMLIEPAATERGIELLCRDAFYREVHSQVFEAIASLTARDEPVDLLTVSDALKDCEMFKTVPAMAFLLNLTEAPSSAANIDYYCQLVQEKYALRKILHASYDMRRSVHDEQPASDIIAQTEAAVSTISLDRSKDGPRIMRELVDERLDLLERRYENKGSAGMETPFSDYNWYTLGLHRDELTIMAARPSMGKTAAMIQIAAHHAKCHGPVAVFSLEMGAGLLVDRMLSGQSRVHASAMRSARLSVGEWANVGEVATEIQGLPMFIDDASAMTVQELRSKCLRLNRQHKLSLVCVDYLQLLSGTPGSKQNRTNEVSEIARTLKSLARILHCPVLALAQLSRSVEQRQDKRPMLSDLRESGSIEADADVVTFLYRDAYYKRKEGEQQEGDVEKAEWIIAKQRNGPTGTCHLAWNGAYTRFDNCDRTHTESRAPYAEDE